MGKPKFLVSLFSKKSDKHEQSATVSKWFSEILLNNLAAAIIGVPIGFAIARMVTGSWQNEALFLGLVFVLALVIFLLSKVLNQIGVVEKQNTDLLSNVLTYVRSHPEGTWVEFVSPDQTGAKRDYSPIGEKMAELVASSSGLYIVSYWYHKHEKDTAMGRISTYYDTLETQISEGGYAYRRICLYAPGLTTEKFLIDHPDFKRHCHALIANDGRVDSIEEISDESKKAQDAQLPNIEISFGIFFNERPEDIKGVNSAKDYRLRSKIVLEIDSLDNDQKRVILGLLVINDSIGQLTFELHKYFEYLSRHALPIRLKSGTVAEGQC